MPTCILTISCGVRQQWGGCGTADIEMACSRQELHPQEGGSTFVNTTELPPPPRCHRLPSSHSPHTDIQPSHSAAPRPPPRTGDVHQVRMSGTNCSILYQSSFINGSELHPQEGGSTFVNTTELPPPPRCHRLPSSHSPHTDIQPSHSAAPRPPPRTGDVHQVRMSGTNCSILYQSSFINGSASRS